MENGSYPASVLGTFFKFSSWLFRGIHHCGALVGLDFQYAYIDTYIEVYKRIVLFSWFVGRFIGENGHWVRAKQ